ncbi:hypothetical protein Csa_003703 [Cucumis sativus]|uniref:Uncharacterized protein n=1 Tax=Cucumis sativus TaxID=3659 RepID=A0A0A0KL28_CUCSA|nr:hypothetical protein Csa_003703 [Cucumis sativus]
MAAKSPFVHAPALYLSSPFFQFKCCFGFVGSLVGDIKIKQEAKEEDKKRKKHDPKSSEEAEEDVG